MTYPELGPSWARAKVIDRQSLFYSRDDLTSAPAQATLRLRVLRALCLQYWFIEAQGKFQEVRESFHVEGLWGSGVCGSN